jgi:hypothetical protein
VTNKGRHCDGPVINLLWQCSASAASFVIKINVRTYVRMYVCMHVCIHTHTFRISITTQYTFLTKINRLLLYRGIILFVKVIIWNAQAHCVAKCSLLVLEQVVQLDFNRLTALPTALCTGLYKKKSLLFYWYVIQTRSEQMLDRWDGQVPAVYLTGY